MGRVWKKRFWARNDGVAAVEAALLFPLLILIFTAGVELMSALDTRRTVNNASFSLANAAASSLVIDQNRRILLMYGHGLIINNTDKLSNLRTVLKGFERLPDGTFQEIWSWQIGQGNVTMTAQEINDALAGNVASGEGLVLAIVEADHTPFLAGALPDFGNFRGFHAQVPDRISVPIYRP